MWINCHNGFDSNLPGQKMENHKIKENRKSNFLFCIENAL